MKAIIFDVDNTLIDWKDEFVFALRNILKDLNPNITEEEIKKIDQVIDDNDKNLKTLDKKIFLDYINKSCNLNFKESFVDRLIKEQGNCYYEDKELISTLEYLSQKYDLYVISNWFTETQKIRLENMHVAKYFKKIIGADINYLKPNIKAFNIILKDYKPEDCVYIGDNFEFDIIPAKQIGMNVIWKTNKVSNDYITIKNIKELKNIL